MLASSTTVHLFNKAAVATLFLLFCAPGCTDEGETLTGGAAGSTATGGTGGVGAGGAGGAGGGGGASITCLPDSATASLFTIAADDLCAVAVYTAAGAIAYRQPTWGAHGGPLLVAQGPADGEVTLARWTPPNGAGGEITIATKTFDAKIPAGAFAGGEALDLGYRGGTAVSYSNAFPDTSGELVILGGANADERYPVNGIFSMLSLHAASGDSTGRLAYTGLSLLGDASAGTNGLYAADDCDGSLLPGADPACAAPIEVAAWGDASGPAVSDSQRNVFVVMTNFAGDQVARGFAGAKIAEGAPAAEGDALFTLDGFGQSLAAIAPSGAAPGILAFQPSDAMSFEALDVLQIRYSASGDAITVTDPPAALLTFPSPNTPVALITDPQDRLWVGVPVMSGGEATTTFVVLTRRP